MSLSTRNPRPGSGGFVAIVRRFRLYALGHDEIGEPMARTPASAASDPTPAAAGGNQELTAERKRMRRKLLLLPIRLGTFGMVPSSLQVCRLTPTPNDGG